MNQKKIDALAELIYQHSPMSREHSRHVAEVLDGEGYCKLEWISVRERLPETKKRYVTFADQDISNGEIVGEEEVVLPVSDFVVVVTTEHIGDGEFVTFPSIDKRVGCSWLNSMGVTHWMPLPELPKMKGEDNEQRAD